MYAEESGTRSALKILIAVQIEYFISVQLIPYEVISALRYNPVIDTYRVFSKSVRVHIGFGSFSFLCWTCVFVDSIKMVAECDTTVNAVS